MAGLVDQRSISCCVESHWLWGAESLSSIAETLSRVPDWFLGILFGIMVGRSFLQTRYMVDRVVRRGIMDVL